MVATQERPRADDVPLMRVEDVARMLGCTTRNVRKLADRGVLPRPLRLTSRLIYWRREEFDEWLEKKWAAARRRTSGPAARTSAP